MFRLQRLEITGFKSFADYTEVLFTGNGITAVVGPNGCGKSNISDAISWVLGEQRAKALRGDEMKDLIFQGTAKRQPSGMAEVILHLVRTEDAYEENDLDEIDEALSEFDEHAVHAEDFDPAVIETTATDVTETSAAGPDNAPVTAEPAENTTEAAGEVSSSTAASTSANGAAAATAIAPEVTDRATPETPETPEAAPAENAEAQVGVAAGVKKAVKRHWRPRKVELDFAPGESVSVTRRLYRSGESEYLLNNKACRLRDIQDLFSGTGLSGAHYAIVEQGRIGQILSAKPADRRALIEEAAGIAKFRTRQRAAEVRLETARTNLRRISDIVEEIERQANSLRRQASKTKRYKVLQEEFRGLLGQVFAAEAERFENQLEDLKGRLAAAQEEEANLTAEISDLEENFRQATQWARATEEELAEIRARHSASALERDRNDRELRFQEKQIADLQARLDNLHSESGTAESRINEVVSEITRLREDEGRHASESDKEQADLAHAEEKYQAKVAEMRELEKAREAKRAEFFQHTTAVERFFAVSRQLEDAHEKLRERAETLVREGERAESVYNETSAAATALSEMLAEMRGNFTALQEKEKEESARVAEAKETLRAAESELDELRENHSATRYRLDSLQELEAKHAIYQPAVQNVFAAQDEIGVRFAGTLADRLRVSAEAELAVENLFGPLLQTILADSGADAVRAAKYLGANNIGRVSVMALDGEAGPANADGPADDAPAGNIVPHLGISPEFAAKLARVFPREMSARIVDSVDEAAGYPGDTCVTRDGVIVTGGKLFTAGKTKDDSKDSSLLAFKREIRELTANLTELAAQLQDLETSVTGKRDDLREKQAVAEKLRADIAAAERELYTRGVEEKTLAQELERTGRHRKVVSEESAQVTREIESIKERAQKTADEIALASEAKAKAETELSGITAELNDIRTDVERENTNVGEQRATAAAAAERRRAVGSSLRRVETEQTELESRIARHSTERTENESKRAEAAAIVAALKEKIASAEDEERAEHGELTAAFEKLKTARSSADTMAENLTELNQKAAATRNARAEVEIQQAEYATRLQNLRETCQHELSQSLEELAQTVEFAEDFVYETGRARLDELRNRLENYGAVNLLALEELAEIEERFLFLTSQRQDIVDSIRSAEEALREIKTRSRERFREAFEHINANFSEFFVELFGGGKGEMTLLEADDILDAGIEVVAQPPGKRLQSIMLLSGGEKALSAIALVMGIFKYRPSPFCLLDEVDAPLDEANIGRFVNKIDEMSEKTQFIVVTHSKRTMESARALYGVTMEEAGVSKLVSVKFE